MSHVSTAQIAKALNLSTRRVSQLVEQGVLPKAGRGQFELGPVMAAYIRYMQTAFERRELLTDDGESADVRRQRARLLKAQADDAEIELSKKRGELLPLDVFEQEMGNMISTMRQNVLNLPGRLAPRLVGETSQGKIREVVRGEVYRALESLTLKEPYWRPGRCPSCGGEKPLPAGYAADEEKTATERGGEDESAGPAHRPGENLSRTPVQSA